MRKVEPGNKMETTQRLRVATRQVITSQPSGLGVEGPPQEREGEAAKDTDHGSDGLPDGTLSRDEGVSLGERREGPVYIGSAPARLETVQWL